MDVSFRDVAQPATIIEISIELVENTPCKMRNRAKEKSLENVVFSRLSNGGEYGIRTRDPLTASQVRSHCANSPGVACIFNY